VPVLIGVRTPLLLIEATPIVVELQIPPFVELFKVVALPIQTELAPVMAATVGKGLIVTQVCV
jgi:hypothetical protein